MNTILRVMLLLVVVIMTPSHIGQGENSVPVLIEESVSFIETPAPLPEKVASHSKVFLITIDGVRWQEVFYGTDSFLFHGQKLSARELLPNLYHYFVDGGIVIGKDSEFVASGPRHISLPGYLEIMRGHPSTDCQSNQCGTPKLDGTIADLFDDSTIISSWETIKYTVPDKFPVNCSYNYRTPAWIKSKAFDIRTGPQPFGYGYRPDALTKTVALSYLRDHRPDFMWISLGDTDEWGHASNYNKYIEALRGADELVGQVINLTEGDPYTFIVTADHGRGVPWSIHGPDARSAKDWLMMTGANIPAKGFVQFQEKKSLSNILPTVRELVTGYHTKESLL